MVLDKWTNKLFLKRTFPALISLNEFSKVYQLLRQEASYVRILARTYHILCSQTPSIFIIWCSLKISTKIHFLPNMMGLKFFCEKQTRLLITDKPVLHSAGTCSFSLESVLSPDRWDWFALTAGITRASPHGPVCGDALQGEKHSRLFKYWHRRSFKFIL